MGDLICTKSHIGKQAKLDSYRGNTIENQGCLLASERDSISGG